jgi:hypothetical protein
MDAADAVGLEHFTDGRTQRATDYVRYQERMIFRILEAKGIFMGAC